MIQLLLTSMSNKDECDEGLHTTLVADAQLRLEFFLC